MTRSDTLRPVSASAPASAGMVEAQMLGQSGARRGLREGAPALQRARRAYLAAEWTGAGDRRPEAGLLARTAL